MVRCQTESAAQNTNNYLGLTRMHKREERTRSPNRLTRLPRTNSSTDSILGVLTVPGSARKSSSTNAIAVPPTLGQKKPDSTDQWWNNSSGLNVAVRRRDTTLLSVGPENTIQDDSFAGYGRGSSPVLDNEMRFYGATYKYEEP